MFLFFLHCILWWGVVPFVVDAESIFCSHSFGLAIVVFERVAQVPDERIGDEIPTYQAKFWLFFVRWKIPVASLAVCSNPAVAMHSTKKSRSGYPDLSISAKMAVHRACCQPLKRNDTSVLMGKLYEIMFSCTHFVPLLFEDHVLNTDLLNLIVFITYLNRICHVSVYARLRTHVDMRRKNLRISC